MKTCPVCQATLFDDMDVCYGCMHEFTPKLEEKEASKEAPLRAQEGVAPTLRVPLLEPQPQARSLAGAPVQAVQTLGEGHAAAPANAPWMLKVEMRSGDEPRTAWSVELVPSSAREAAATAAAGTPAEPRLLGVRSG